MDYDKTPKQGEAHLIDIVNEFKKSLNEKYSKSQDGLTSKKSEFISYINDSRDDSQDSIKWFSNVFDKLIDLVGDTTIYLPVKVEIAEMEDLKKRVAVLERSIQTLNTPVAISENKAQKPKANQHIRIQHPLLEAVIEESEAKDKDSLKIFDEVIKYLVKLDSIITRTEDETIRVDEIDKTLTNFLAAISEVNSPVRSQLVEYPANYSNKFLKHYIFVSPEMSKRFNQDIHQFIDKRNMYIKEGVSYLIRRKDTNTVFKKAKVKAHDS